MISTCNFRGIIEQCSKAAVPLSSLSTAQNGPGFCTCYLALAMAFLTAVSLTGMKSCLAVALGILGG